MKTSFVYDRSVTPQIQKHRMISLELHWMRPTWLWQLPQVTPRASMPLRYSVEVGGKSLECNAGHFNLLATQSSLSPAFSRFIRTFSLWKQETFFKEIAGTLERIHCSIACPSHVTRMPLFLQEWRSSFWNRSDRHCVQRTAAQHFFTCQLRKFMREHLML